MVLRLFHSLIGTRRGGAGCVKGARHVQLAQVSRVCCEHLREKTGARGLTMCAGGCWHMRSCACAQ